MTSSATNVDLAQIAADVFEHSSREMGLTKTGLFPQHIRDRHDQITSDFAEIVAAGRQLENDRAELHKKRDLLPGAGFLRLQSEAIAEADRVSSDAYRRAQRNIAELHTELRDAALPKLDKNREQLARQELAMLLGEGTDARARAVNIARGGSRDALSVLVSDFGADMLRVRGLGGRDLDETLDAIRKIAAGSVATRKGSTVDELAAGAAWQQTPSLSAAVAAAKRYVNQAGKSGRS